MESKELAIRLARALDAKKAVNVHILAVEDLTTVTEYFVIATGMSTTHVGALADEAEFQLDREGVKVLRTEGHDGKRWVLLDYGSVIVHVFTQEAHDYYDLEHLWADATVVPASEWMPDEGADEQYKCGTASPSGGSCQRPRPLTDEGQTFPRQPINGQRRHTRPSSGPAGPPSVYALRAAFGGCAPTRACGRSPSGGRL